MINKAEIILTGTDVSMIHRPVEISDRRDKKDIVIIFLANPCNVTLSHSHGFDKVYNNCDESSVQSAIEDAKAGASSILISEVVDFQKMNSAHMARIHTGRGLVKMLPPTDAPDFIKFWIGNDALLQDIVLDPEFPKDELSVETVCIYETPSHLVRQMTALTAYIDSLSENLAHPVRRIIAGQSLNTREFPFIDSAEWLFLHGWIVPTIDGWIANSECRRLLMRKSLQKCRIHRI